MRVVFMGTPDFALPALKRILDEGHEVLCVYSQPPRRSGRGKNMRPSSVHQYALSRNIEVRCPQNFRDPLEVTALRAFEADLAVVVAYGLLLSEEVLAAPKWGCINIHASLLPRWRGAAPIHRAIMAGDVETGVSIMKMDRGLDTGPVLSRRVCPIAPNETTATLHQKLSEMGGAAIAEVLADFPRFEAAAQPQAVSGVTYAHKIEKSEAGLKFDQSAEVVDRQIRGLSPFPGAWILLNDERIKLLNAEVISRSEKLGKPGEILDEKLTIACNPGAVRMTEIQRAGKKPLRADAFANGFRNIRGRIINP